MDRFKFRAWDKTENAYIEDAQFTYDDGCEGGMGSFRHYSFRDLLEDKNCIVEQCTGLKDKNGKLIYEGDIVKINGWWDARGWAGYDKNQTVVKWNENFAGYEPMCIYDCDCGVYHNAEECEIIGNIHENKELLDE